MTFSVNPDVTVGIPFYQGSNIEHFRAAIESILSQSLLPKEIHLIQDGSVTKDLEDIVVTYTRKYPYLRHIVLAQNLGLAHALNVSILNSSTKYYARMDSDDISHPERLQIQVDFLEKNPKIDILGTWALEFENNPFTEEGFLRRVPIEEKDIRTYIHYRNPLIHPSVIFRRSIFAKIGLYNINFKKEEDLELWARAIKRNVGIINIPQVLLYYRFTGSVKRRAMALIYQIKARYYYNTWSIKLNILKMLSLLFRVFPSSFQEWGYKRLR